MFHLVTHAFFKAMLFLCSGSVIHAMEDVVGHEPVLAQDMRLMGGLRKFMPITSTTFFIGCLAISGIPPLAGFWSKDEILGQAFGSFPLLWAAGFITAGMTAFYMFRLYFLTFEGSFRGTDKTVQAQLMAAAGKGAADEHGDDHGHSHADHPHESGWQMAMPLAVLAVPSMLIGLLGTPWNSRFARLLNPEEAAHMAKHFSWGELLPLAGASVAVSMVGITVSVLAYALHKIDLGTAVAGRFPAINAFLANKWYLDAINDKLFVQGTRKLARQVLEVDSKVVDGVVNLTGLVTLGSGEGLKYLETGRAQFYALIVFGGVIALVVLFGALG
jgi:NAD(P)H-quinone oxidoreductase subunit 5